LVAPLVSKFLVDHDPALALSVSRYRSTAKIKRILASGSILGEACVQLAHANQGLYVSSTIRKG
jgi:hypothetical protein